MPTLSVIKLRYSDLVAPATRRRLVLSAMLASVLLLLAPLPVSAELIENLDYEGDKTIIRWTYWGAAPTVRTYRQVVRAFTREHPEIAVELVILPWGQYWTKLQTQAASGLAPDVISLISATAGVWVNHGAVRPLDAFLTESGLDLTEYYPGAVDSMHWYGQQYGLPFELSAGAILYSEDRLEEAGIPREQWPRADKAMSWSEFKALARQLTLRDERGNIVQYGIGSGGWWNDMLYSLYGGYFFDRQVNPTEPTIVGNEALTRAVIEVFQMMHAERIQVPSAVAKTAEYGGIQILRSNRFAMAYHGAAELETINNYGVRFGITPLPSADRAIKQMSVNVAGIYRDTEHPQEAWKLVKFLTSPTAQSIITHRLSSVPVNRKSSDAFINNAFSIPGVEALLVDMEHAKPLVAPAASYVQKAYLTWLERLDNDLNVEYDRRLSVLQATHETIDDTIYDAFVDEMRGVVDAKVRQRLLVLDADLRTAFARMNPPVPSTGNRVLLPIFLMSMFGAAFLLYVRYVRRQNAKPQQLSSSKNNVAAFLCLSPWLIGFVMFTIGPIIASAYLSFTEWNMISAPKWVGAQHYLGLFEDKYFLMGLERTFTYAAFVIPISLIGGIATAGLLTSNVRGADSFKAIFYFPSLFTGAAAAVLWVHMFHQEWGIVNRMLSVFGVMPVDWLDEFHAFYTVILMNVFWIGGATLIYYAGMKQIPRSLYEAAEIDGAGTVRRFFSITLPMLSPVILFMVIMTTIGSFQIFTPALFFVDNPAQIGGPGDSLRFYAVNIYDEAFNNLHMGKASAWAFVLFVIIFAVTMLQIKLSKRFVHTEN